MSPEIKQERRPSFEPPPLQRSRNEGFVSTHFFLKWPVYIFIATTTVLLLSAYAAVRGLIRIFESLIERSYVKKMRLRMLAAKTYREWQRIARKLETYSGVDAWKHTRKSRYYNSEAIERYTKELQTAKSSDDVPHLISILGACLSDPLTKSVFREELYSQCWDGTKTAVEEYIQTVLMAICYLTQIAPEKRQLFPDITAFIDRTGYGKTALCLSGGGSLGQQHLGVMKTLLEEGVLPTVISGTSAGAVVGAFVCCRTKEELDRDFNSDYLFSISTALRSPWTSRITRFIRTGYLFDYTQWEKDIVPWTLGDITFLEAYRKTGRVLNVSTTANNVSVNLNYITSPNVLVRSAVLCSSAIPLFVPGPQLLEKNPRTGEIIPRDVQNFSDGSLAGDVPRAELASLFGVRFVLTSQVNPHITPFFFNRKGEAGNPLLWRWGKQGSFRGGFLLSALESLIKEQMKTLLKVMGDLEIDPAFRGMALPQAFLQNFEGDITVTSHRSFLWKIVNCLESPKSSDEVEWWIKEGELSMWPKMSVIVSRMRIEKALQDLSKALKQKNQDSTHL
jgi:predicted acylesterase/phospholipase RssA